jgi:predicted transposase/invertase (TIGR01784 family)
MSKGTERELISFDWAVKKLLRSKANFEVLEGFLSELLFDDIKILEVLESESNRENENDKFNRVDIKVKNSKNEILIIEVQFDDERDFFQRLLYSSSKNICEHLDRGEPYSNVIKVISINILYFDLGEGSDYIYKGQTVFNGIHNNSTLKLTDDQRDAFKKEYPSEIFPEYYIIKVNNFNDVAKSTLDEWIYLFKNSAIKSEFTAKGIVKAGEILDIMKMSKIERQIYDRYIDNRRVALDQLQTAMRKGIRQERKIQEAKIKQLEDKHSKELKEKDSQLQEKDSQLQEKDNKLQQLAKMLLANGVSKKQIFKQTGIKL